MNWILDHVDKRKTGLSPHYPLLYSVVAGLETKVAFEFGAGISTKVILEALKLTGGKLYTISTQDIPYLSYAYGLNNFSNWNHVCGKSIEVLKSHLKNLDKNNEKLDFVLHDGAHDYKTVLFDLQNIIPYMKQYSIMLIHDTLHSKCGTDTRGAAVQALYGIPHDKVTLPFGFGLTIVRINGNLHNGSLIIKKEKPESKHFTNIF